MVTCFVLLLREKNLLTTSSTKRIQNLSSDKSGSEDSSVGDEQQPRGLISPSEQVWTLNRPTVAGQQVQPDVFSGIQQFRRGLHPESRVGSFEVHIFFNSSIDCAVRSIHVSCRRLAHEKHVSMEKCNYN